MVRRMLGILFLQKRSLCAKDLEIARPPGAPPFHFDKDILDP